jgi:CBS domain containing-hemolysin-like protein
VAVDLTIAVLLVLANGFFVATEFAIARLRPTQVAEFEREGRPGARSVRHAVEHIDSYLAACQLGITLASLGLGVVGEPAFEHLLQPVFGERASVAGWAMASIVAFSVITLLHVVVGELAPKSLAIARTTGTVLYVAPIMRGFYILTRPLVELFNALGNLLLKPFGVPPATEAGHAPHSEDELRTLLRQSQREGLIDADERLYAENVFTFGDSRARDVLRPRPEIVFVITDQTVREAAERALETGHSRLPLCEPSGGLDAPVGVLHVQDLLRAVLAGEPSDLRAIARPLSRVLDGIRVDELLRELRHERQHLALVVDEHRTTVGLVTLEDVVEEIVGEIEDEFDQESPPQIWRVGDDVVVHGSASVRLVSEKLGLPMPDPHEATIGGHVVEMLGRMPAVGEVIDFHGQDARVSGVDEVRVTELRFEGLGDRLPAPESEPGGGAHGAVSAAR